jgi:ABC-type branched-subunit amino acid transport system ATPase component/branched-subunit amino acid ABC-type transport system permease component
MHEVIRFALLGFGIGAMYTLAAQGLIVIYRGSGVLNFAQGAIGMVGAYVEWECKNRGVPFGVSLILGIAAAAALGALTHLIVMRPLRHASPLARIVATLGVLISIQAGAVLKYGSGVTYVPTELPDNVWSPWGLTISIDRLILFGIAAALTVALYGLYRYTKFGLSTSAAAENERASASLGISPNLIATANWALGSGLAGLAAILIAPIVTLQVGTITNLVLAALAAALVASFRSFPIAFAGGMLIGIAQTELDRYATPHASLQGLSKSLPFFVIIVFLAVRGQAIPLRDFFLQRLPLVGTGRVRPTYVLLGIAVATVLVLTLSNDWIAAFTVTFAVAVVLLSIVVLTGYAGQISLAQFAIAGFGAWVAGRLVDAENVPFWGAALIGILATVPLGVLFALPAVRTRGINLAIVTLGLGTAIELMIFNNGKYVGGFAGTVVGAPTLFGWNISPFDHPARYCLFALGCFVVLALMVANLRRSRTGRRLLAVRTNERAAAALGISVPQAKLYAFGVSAGIAAVGGILFGFMNETITYSQTFTNFNSITYVGLAFIGGIGFLAGPIYGATLANGSVGTQIMNTLFSQNAANYLTLVSGITVIVLVLLNQDGIARETINQIAWVRSKLRLPAVRVPSLRRRAEAPEVPPVEKRGRVRPQKLEVRNLTVRYGAVVAVDDVSLDVSPGRITGLIGPNGAGKTTLIDAVTGFTPLASGTVTLNGEDIRKRSVARRARDGISRSFQSLELFEDSTVLDNLRAASDPRDALSYLRDLVWPVTPPLPAEVVTAIREFDLEHDLHRTVQDLPYGERRLLAIARAVATEPSILLLDEPAAGLGDAETRELEHLVRRLADEWGMGVLLIEHDVQFVMSVCDHIVVLDFGKPIAEGTPEEIRNNPSVIGAYLGETEEEAEQERALVGEAGQ